MNKKAISKISKSIIVAQLLIVILALAFITSFAPKTKYPNDGMVSDENIVDFKFRNANVILVDDNQDFSSPNEIDVRESNLTKMKFPPGTYYWKAIGILESPVKKFTINSKVGLEFEVENSSIVNVGNVKVNVSEQNSHGLSGLSILDVEVEYPVKPEEDTIYRGEQYEN